MKTNLKPAGLSALALIAATLLSLTLPSIWIEANLHAQPGFSWARQMGGTNDETGNSIATDASGNVYTTGSFQGTVDFDPGLGTYTLTTGSATTAIFISKLDATGNFVWAKQMGGSAAGTKSVGSSIVLDASNNIYVTGYTDSVGFQTQSAGAAYFDATHNGGKDAVIMKFDPSGNLLWSTYYGGGRDEEGRSITIKNGVGGEVFVVGWTLSTNISTIDPGSGAYYQGAKSGGKDAFILKFSNAATMLWATYYGGAADEEGNSVDAIGGSAGAVFVVGWTLSTNFPTLNPGSGAYYQGTLAGGKDVFIIKFTNAGVHNWATYYGGSGDEEGLGIGENFVFNAPKVVGWTLSTNLPVQAGTCGIQSTIGGGKDAFILEFSFGGQLSWATYYGGSGDDKATSVVVSYAYPYGNYITGSFSSTMDFDPGAGIHNMISAGNSDVFITKLNESGCFKCAGQMGGTNDEVANSIATDVNGNILTTGSFQGVADFDPGSGNLLMTSAGSNDIFVNKFTTAMNFTTTQTNVLCNGQCTGSATVSNIGGSGSAPYTYSWGGWALPTQTTATATGLCAGNYTVVVSPTNFCGWGSTQQVYITEPTALVATYSVTPATGGNNNGTASATASGGTAPYTYSWSSTPVQTTPVATGLAAGNYTLTVTDANGCTVTYTISTTPTAIGQNNLQAELSIIPNPSHGMFELTLSTFTNDDFTIELSNNIGQVVYTEELRNFSGRYSKKLDVSEFGKGIYVMSVKNNTGQVFKKLVVY